MNLDTTGEVRAVDVHLALEAREVERRGQRALDRRARAEGDDADAVVRAALGLREVHELQRAIQALQRSLLPDQPNGSVNRWRNRSAGHRDTYWLAQLSKVKLKRFRDLVDGFIDRLGAPVLEAGQSVPGRL